MREAVADHDRRAERAYQAPGQGRGSADGDLLAENGADREFESIPTAGDSHTRPGRDESFKQGVVAKIACDLTGIGGQIEQPPNPLDDKKQPAGLGKTDA